MIQRDPNSASRQFYLPGQQNSFHLSNHSYYLNGGQFDSMMGPYQHYNQQPTNLQANGIPPNSPITSSTSSQSPYSSALQTRSGDCTTIPHRRNSRHPIVDQNCLTSHHYSNNTHLHPNDANTTNANYFHPSAPNSNLHSVNSNIQHSNMHGSVNRNNLLDYNEENRFIPDIRNQQPNYHHSDLVTNHNMVRRHRSLPAGSFQQELNPHPFNKHLNDQVYQRSASLKAKLPNVSY